LKPLTVGVVFLGSVAVIGENVTCCSRMRVIAGKTAEECQAIGGSGRDRFNLFEARPRRGPERAELCTNGHQQGRVWFLPATYDTAAPFARGGLPAAAKYSFLSAVKLIMVMPARRIGARDVRGNMAPKAGRRISREGGANGWCSENRRAILYGRICCKHSIADGRVV